MFELAGTKISFLVGTLGQGGAEQQLFYMLRSLTQAGVTPRVLTLARGEFWEERIERLNVPVVWVGQHSSRIRRLKRIVMELRREPPDILQSLHFYTNAYAGLCRFLPGLKTIGSMRSNGKSEMSDCGRIGGNLSLRAPEVIAANSREAVRFAVRQGLSPERLFLLGNAVDTNCFVPSPGQDRKVVRLLAVGRMRREKRFDRFIRMVHRLHSLPGIRVKGTIVGPGQGKNDVKGELELEAQRLDLPADVLEFSGAATDMAAVYQKADICVLTSDFEGTPNAVLEAMSCGLPVVATRVGGVPDIISHGETGFLADPENELELFEAVAILARNPERRRRMGENARRFVIREHSLDHLGQRLGELYQKVLRCAE